MMIFHDYVSLPEGNIDISYRVVSPKVQATDRLVEFNGQMKLGGELLDAITKEGDDHRVGGGLGLGVGVGVGYFQDSYFFFKDS